MAKGKRINQRQFAEVTAKLHASLYIDTVATTAPVDCIALLAFIQAAQSLYDEHCSIAAPMRPAKSVKK